MTPTEALEQIELEVAGAYRVYSQILKTGRKIKRQTGKDWLDDADEQTLQSVLRLHQAATMDYSLNYTAPKHQAALRAAIKKRSQT